MIYTDALVSLFAFGGIYAAGTFGWNTIQIGTFGIMLAIAGTFGAWLGGKLDDKLGPKRVIAGSMCSCCLRSSRSCWWTRIRFCSSRSRRPHPAAHCSQQAPSALICCSDA